MPLQHVFAAALLVGSPIGTRAVARASDLEPPHPPLTEERPERSWQDPNPESSQAQDRDAQQWRDHGDAELSAQRFQAAADAYRKSAQLALMNGDLVLRTAALGNLAIASLELGDLDTARDAIQGAIEACEPDGTPLTLCKLLNIEGAVHQRRGDSRSAAATYRRALELADELGDDRRRVAILNNIAVSSMNCGAYDEALQFIARVEDLGQRHDDPNLLSIAWTNRGETLHLMGRHEEALVPLQMALEVRREQGDERRIAETLIGIGVARKDLGQTDAALEHLQEALDIADRLNLGLDRIVILAHQADVYASLGDGSASLAAAKASRDAHAGTAALERLGVVQEALSRAHEAAGDLELALEYQRKAFETHARLQHERTTTDLRGLQFDMESRETAKRRMWLIAGGAGALGVIGFLVLVLARGRRHAHRQREDANHSLQELESALQLNAQALHMASTELADLRSRLRSRGEADLANEMLRP